MDISDQHRIRLSDRILSALELSLEQGDIQLSELLTQALEVATTRKAGGGDFIERRDYPQEIENAMDKLKELRAAENSAQ